MLDLLKVVKDETLVFKINTLNRLMPVPHRASQPKDLENIWKRLVSKILRFSTVFMQPFCLSHCYLDAMRYCFGIRMNKKPLAQSHLRHIKNAPSFLSLPIAEFLTCPKSILWYRLYKRRYWLCETSILLWKIKKSFRRAILKTRN